MPYRFYFLFPFFSLLFLFYPGDSQYLKIFAYHRKLFSQRDQPVSIKLHPVPVRSTSASPFIFAEGVYVADLPSFTPVFEKNSSQRFLPASTAKIITALVAYDIYKPDQVITVKNIQPDGQTMGLFEGEKITVENLLYGVLVHSGNDAAYALAQNHGLSKFVDLMNRKARQLHMRNTHVRNPSGFDEFGQYTTPYDLALAARELLKNKYLSKIVSTKEIVISDVDFKYFHTLTNVNKLLGEIQGIGGLKTGYTENAGENLVSFYKTAAGHELIIVVVKSTDRFEDTKKIVEWIDKNVDYVNLQ